MEPYSIVENLGWHENYKCGYCKSKDSNISYGIWAHILNVSDYQNLLDRGWRRSGKFCYKPDILKMCCPHHTIRCEANNFIISKSQKKVLKKMESYLNGTHDDRKLKFNETSVNMENNKIKSHDKLNNLISYKKDLGKNKFNPGIGQDPNKPLCKKKKLLKKEKFLLKMQEKLTSKDNKNDFSLEPDTLSKTLEDYLCLPIIENSKHALKIKLVSVNTSNLSFKDSLNESYNLYRKYQSEIHKSQLSEIKFESYKEFLVETPLFVENSAQTKDNPINALKEDFQNQFIPLITTFGTFHCQYWMDEKLVAVGVIDILPNCLSSKYFYYDPNFSHLSLGVYSALCEVAMCRKYSIINPSFKYYYMGYYIHSCSKMRYKSKYEPCFLLCNKNLDWHPFQQCLPMLESSNSHCINFCEDNENRKNESKMDLDSLLLYCQFKIYTYSEYIARYIKKGIKKRSSLAFSSHTLPTFKSSSNHENSNEEDPVQDEIVQIRKTLMLFVEMVGIPTIVLFRES
ncbi:arginyl-tRNA--protein transferase 1-like [Gordionus sp. m RMFG-2023]|uniref:arginyl-tRNA--protein transferase 1-like n=1 Tax=Gordionus sp. m RMFG-2023 TaxID=3053472 RepID=UPI0031FC7553